MDAARGMVESGDWLVPYYEGQPFFDKPILSYWLMAAAMTLLGPTPGAARLVAVLASVGIVAATAWLGTLVFDRRAALAGSVVLASTVAFLSFARVAMSDMLLAAFTTAATALGLIAYRVPSPRWAVPALGLVLGLGFATKGPIALLVPGIAILLLLVREKRLPAGAGPIAVAAALFAVLGLGWFALVYARLGSGPLEYFFLRENLSRFAGETYDIGRPAWFYLPAYAAEGLPWSLFLPLAAWRLLARPEDREHTRWLLLWVALFLVPLSLSRGKLDYYLLPAYPALSLVVGRYFSAMPQRGLDRGWARGVLLAFAAACAGLLVLRPLRLPLGWAPLGAEAQLVAAALAALALLLAAALRVSPWRTLGALATTVATGYALAAIAFVPAFAAAQPNGAIAADVERERRYVYEARFVYCDDPSHARRDVLFLARHAGLDECDLWSLAGSREPYLFLVTPAQDASLRVLPGYRHVATYEAVPARALTLPGLLAGPQPRRLLLVANFATSDPVADRKKRKEYRRAVRRAWLEAGQAPAAGKASPPGPVRD